MSSYIHNKSVGDHIMVQGPMANRSLLKKLKKIENKKYDMICIASGTGICPMLQLINYFFDSSRGSNAAPGTCNKKQKIFLVWFLKLARNKSTSFKGATQIDAMRKKYGSRFTYAIMYTKESTVREQLSNVINSGQFTDSHCDTGENAFQRAELMSRHSSVQRRKLFRKKKSSSFGVISHKSLNFLPKSELSKMQSLFDETKHFDMDVAFQLISMITDHWDEHEKDEPISDEMDTEQEDTADHAANQWNEQFCNEIQEQISDEMNPEQEDAADHIANHWIEQCDNENTPMFDEMYPEQEDSAEATPENMRSVISGVAVAICGSPMLDDNCFEIFKELGFNEEQLILFGAGDSPLTGIDEVSIRNIECDI